MIGYLGPRGTNSEGALTHYLSAHPSSLRPVPKPTFSHLFEALDKGELEQILVPLENSIGGSIDTALDLLIKYENIYISKEIVFNISLHLMSSNHPPFTDIISHPQCLAQCEQFLMKTYPQAKMHHAPSTAQAVSIMQDHFTSPSHSPAIIGSKELSELHQLPIHHSDIQDKKNNQTRFGILSKTTAPPSKEDKTSIVFSTQQDTPGSLYSILGEFQTLQINLTRISSRPTKNKLGEYLFFIDFLGHCDDDRIQEVLAVVKEKALFYKFLGSYGVAE